MASLFDDPFFFDLDAFKGMDHASGAVREFNDGFENNFFEGFNVTAIVLEVPNTIFRSQHIGVWATTTEAHGLQVDRMGLPAINTVFIRPNRFYHPGGNFKNAFNFGHPFFDRADFLAEVVVQRRGRIRGRGLDRLRRRVAPLDVNRKLHRLFARFPVAVFMSKTP